MRIGLPFQLLSVVFDIISVSARMSNNSRFKYRFIRPDEAKRLSELIGQLQKHQQMNGVKKLPNQSDVMDNLFHTNDRGDVVPHNLGTFTALCIDTSTPDEANKSNVIGYLIYSLKFSLVHGRQFYINSFFIEKPYRRLGLGRKLIKFMQSHGKLLGINQFDVPFMKNNIVGQKFYKSFGAYLVDEEYNIYALPSDFESYSR